MCVEVEGIFLRSRRNQTAKLKPPGINRLDTKEEHSDGTQIQWQRQKRARAVYSYKQTPRANQGKGIQLCKPRHRCTQSRQSTDRKYNSKEGTRERVTKKIMNRKFSPHDTQNIADGRRVNQYTKKTQVMKGK